MEAQLDKYCRLGDAEEVRRILTGQGPYKYHINLNEDECRYFCTAARYKQYAVCNVLFEYHPRLQLLEHGAPALMYACETHNFTMVEWFRHHMPAFQKSRELMRRCLESCVSNKGAQMFHYLIRLSGFTPENSYQDLVYCFELAIAAGNVDIMKWFTHLPCTSNSVLFNLLQKSTESRTAQGFHYLLNHFERQYQFALSSKQRKELLDLALYFNNIELIDELYYNDTTLRSPGIIATEEEVEHELLEIYFNQALTGSDTFNATLYNAFCSEEYNVAVIDDILDEHFSADYVQHNLLKYVLVTASVESPSFENCATFFRAFSSQTLKL